MTSTLMLGWRLMKQNTWMGLPAKVHRFSRGLTTMCRSGLATLPPPACSTNPAGVWKLPWQMQTILISSPFLYLYRKPSTLLPLGSPLVNTLGISCIIALSTCPMLLALAAAVPEVLCWFPLGPRAVVLPVKGVLPVNRDDEDGGLATVAQLAASPAGGPADDGLCSSAVVVPGRSDKNIRWSFF